MNAPDITVLMPAYNGSEYLREAIESILNQTYTNFEFLIINDGSIDSSEEIILSYNDKRIRYLKNEKNLGLIATLNKGFKLATGTYIARSDADDINYLNRLALQYEFMEQNPEIGLLGTGFELFGEGTKNKIVQYAANHDIICLKHLYQIHLSHGTSIFRTDVIKQHNLYFDSDFAHAEDYELWTRISKVSKLANLQQVLYKVRQHNYKVSEIYSTIQQENSLRIKQRQFIELGIQPTTAEILLYEKVAQYEYEANKDFIFAAHSLLKKLVEENEKTSFINRDFFRKSIGQFWFNINYNLCARGISSPKQFFASPLCRYRPITLIEKIKFMFKFLLKKQK